MVWLPFFSAIMGRFELEVGRVGRRVLDCLDQKVWSRDIFRVFYMKDRPGFRKDLGSEINGLRSVVCVGLIIVPVSTALVPRLRNIRAASAGEHGLAFNWFALLTSRPQ